MRLRRGGEAGVRLALTLPLYVGGFMGPFGGSVLSANIPDIAGSLHTSPELVTGAITAYMVPFAGLQLVSAPLSQRIGPRRLVRSAYVLYAVASLVCAFSPSIVVFMGGRALMGAGNAFLSPILLAALAEAVPRQVLGRSVGTFAAWQTAGFTLGPAIGGAIGLVNWRGSFLLVAACAIALAVPAGVFSSVAATSRKRSLRPLVNRRMALLGAKALLGYMSFMAIGFILVLFLADEFGAGSGTRGLILAGSGIGGVLTGRLAGSLSDRLGRPVTALGGAVVCAGAVGVLSYLPSLWSLALVYVVLGCASTFVWTSLNTVVVETFPNDRAGAVSLFSFFRTSGVALSPPLYAPLYAIGMHVPFLVAAALGAVVALLVLPWFPRYAGRREEPLAPVPARRGAVR